MTSYFIGFLDCLEHFVGAWSYQDPKCPARRDRLNKNKTKQNKTKQKQKKKKKKERKKKKKKTRFLCTHLKAFLMVISTTRMKILISIFLGGG